MNKRQKELYRLLRIYKGQGYISKDTIAYDLEHYYGRSEEHCTDHNSNAYRMIRDDIADLNSSDIKNVIVSSKKGYKIATYEEAVQFYRKKRTEGVIKMMYAEKLRKKIQADGQMEMDFDGFVKEVRTYE